VIYHHQLIHLQDAYLILAAGKLLINAAPKCHYFRLARITIKLLATTRKIKGK